MMESGCLIGLDIGGGSGRCVYWDPFSKDVAFAMRRWSHTPSEIAPGLGYDLDLDAIFDSILKALKELVCKKSLGGRDVKAIGVTGMRNTTVILDSEFKAIFAVPNLDARAVVESSNLASENGTLFHRISGHYPSPVFTAPRLKWLSANQPEVLQQARVVMTLTDWVCYMLTGKIIGDATQSGETLLFDLKKRNWSDELIEITGVNRNLFPEVVPSGYVVGFVKDDLAEFVRLGKNIPVVTSGADTQCALLGACAISNGDICAVAGTTMPVQQVTSRLILDEEARLWSGLHTVPGLFVIESNGLAAGTALEWFSRILFPEYENPVAALLYEAGKSCPGAGGVLSTIGTCQFDARSLNISFGDITLSHMATPSGRKGRQHICRAVAEGIVFSLKTNLDQIIKVTNLKPEVLKVAGGMASSELWTRIVSDVTGMRVEVPQTPEVSGLGACACAGVGSGFFGDYSEVCGVLASTMSSIQPGDDSKVYRKIYASWNNIRCAGDSREVCVTEHMATEMLASWARKATGGHKKRGFCPRVLVTAPLGRKALEKLNEFAQVEYAPWWDTHRVYQGGEKLAEALAGYHVFITEMDVIDFDAMRRLPELRVIISCRGNPVNVDIEAATEYGIAVMNTPGRNADSVADLTIAFMIMLSRKLLQATSFLKKEEVKEGDLVKLAEAYETFRGNELWGKTVGIIGLGNVGRAVARRARSLGARVLFYDPHVDVYSGAIEDAKKCTLDEVLLMSDFVTLHVPASEETKGLIDSNALSMMKSSAYLINTARGSILDEEALISALKNCAIAGAAVDVFSVEPPGSEHPLIRLDNVIATPHIGGDTYEVSEHQGLIAADQLDKLLLGDRPEFLLNPEVMPFFKFTGKRRQPSAETIDRLSKKKKPTITS